MSDKITVTKIEIKIGDTILSLTPEQMNELKDILNHTFPDPTPVHPVPIIVDRPVYPCYPLRYWEYTCCGNTSGHTLRLESGDEGMYR